MKKQIRSTAILIGGYFLAYILLGMTTATLGPALPYLAGNVGTSLRGISSLFVGHRHGYMTGSFLGGHMYDRVSGNRLMAGVMLIMAAGMFATPVIPILALLVVIVFLLGFAEGTVDVGGNVLLVWTKPSRIGPLMNALHLFFGVGALISPLILAQVIRHTGGIRWGYWFVAALAVPVAIFLFLQPSPRAAAPNTDRVAERRYLLLVLIAVFLFLHVGAESAYGSWIYTYALSKQLANEVSAGYLTAAFWGSLTFGRLVTIFLALKVNAKIQLAGSVLGALLSTVILFLWPDSVTAIWIATFGCGFSLAGLFPGTITLASEHLHLTGVVTGLFLVGSSFGAMVLPWLIGQFFESVGPRVLPAFLTAAIVGSIVLLAAIMILLRRNSRSRSMVGDASTR